MRARNVCLCVVVSGALCFPLAAPAADRAWIESSDRNSAIVIEMQGAFHPEFTSELGVDRFDTAVLDLNPENAKRYDAAAGRALVQFATMVERGVSLARAVFAFNSTNVEGWGLYAESLMIPYFPPEGQLFSLQLRLLRAARAFLDPMVNLGRMTPAGAKAFLMREAAFSEPFGPLCI